MSKLKQVMEELLTRQGLDRLGYKAAAAECQVPRTTMRYAKMAYDSGFISAVLCGVIRDGRVVGMLTRIPRVLADAIVRVEWRLSRTLTRARLKQLLRHLKLQVSSRHFNRSDIGMVSTNWSGS